MGAIFPPYIPKPHLRVPARIKRHRLADQTGMIHLDNLEAKYMREKNFPVGSACVVEPAHWYGEVQVFRAFGDDGRMDYFDHLEVQVLDPEGLFRNYPDAYNNSRERFEKAMLQNEFYPSEVPLVG